MRRKKQTGTVMRRMLACFLAVCLLLADASPAWAVGIGEGEWENSTVTAIGDTTIKSKADGSVVIEMTAKTASASWRWRTIGFYLTKDKLAVNENSISGPEGKHGQKGTNSDCTIWLKEDEVCRVDGCPFKGGMDGDRHDVSSGGTTTTTITLTKACIDAHRKKAGITVDGKETTLYMQGVLAFYYGSSYKYGPFYSVDAAKAKNRSLGNGRDWSFYPRSSGEGWVKRYNIPIKFKADATQVSVSYYRKNTKAWKEAGYTTTWTRLKSYNTDDDAEKWTSPVDTRSSLSTGNGLGFQKTDYYEGDRIRHSTHSAPQLLSQVLDGTDYDRFYCYRFSWSNRTDPVSTSTGTRKQRHENYYTGYILDSSGNVTQEYKDWLAEARSYSYTCVSADKDLVLNVYYKKPARAPEEEEDTDSSMAPKPKAVIQSDSRGADWTLDLETYDSTKGIPSSETQYVNVRCKDYLFTVGYTTRTESRDYTYHSGCHWVDTSTTDSEGNTIPSGYTCHHSASTTISCSWTDITSLGIWKIKSAEVKNKSLPGGKVELIPQGYVVNAPDVVYEGCSVSWPPQGTGCCGPPDASAVTCKSGRLVFNGVTILSDEVCHVTGKTPSAFPAPGMCGYDVLYKYGCQIPPELANGEYASKGTVTYTALVNTNTGYASNLTFDITGINDVTVHTPTVSYASVPDDAKEYCQLVSPDAARSQLVLDQYFTVRDSSLGYHSDLRGYGTRNYTVSADKFIAKKEVRFPFDVYGVSGGSPGTYYPADTWIELDLITGEKRFYIPVWVGEGDYAVSFRSRTINCDANIGTDEEQLDAVTEATANTELDNYLSSATTQVTVSGRMFGLTMYDISDYPAWGTNVFRKPSSTQLTGLKYTVGLNDRNGNAYRPASSSKYTFALVDGAHPYFRNYGVLKPGYVQRFQLTTFGDMSYDGDYVEIRPTYYYVTGSGAGQVTQKVDLYYDETVNGKYEHFVKLGSDLDRKNIKEMSLGNLYTSVPQDELEEKAALEGMTVQQLRAETGAMYRYDRIVVPLSSATFVGTRFLPASGLPSGVDQGVAARAAQRWYFEYSLPASVHAVPQGTLVDCGSHSLTVDDYAATYGIDYTEDFWCRGGYLVVNWSIHTVSSRFAETPGGEGQDIATDTDALDWHLDYINRENALQGYCNMWNMEGYQYTKTDSAGKTYSFRDGDILMFYTSGSSVREDYRSFGTH